MNRSMVAAAALFAGIAIAAPMAASSAADDGGQMAQAGPGPMMGMGEHPGDRGPGSGPGGNRGDGPGGGGEHSMEHHGWMQRMMMMRMSPQQRCAEKIARRAGMIAYTIAKLNLNDQQKQLWDKVQQPLQQGADKQRQLCGTLKSRDERAQETLLDRINRREQFLTAHLQTLQQTKPALEQFYQALSPEQKATIDHPFHHG